MLIRFGNLTVQQFANEVGADFTAAELELLESRRTDLAHFDDPDAFHIFDDPHVSVVMGEHAVRDLAPVFVAADQRRTFTAEVGLYPAPVAPLFSNPKD